MNLLRPPTNHIPASFWWPHSDSNIATDLWILGLPISALLQLDPRKKVFLVLMLSAGIVYDPPCRHSRKLKSTVTHFLISINSYQHCPVLGSDHIFDIIGPKCKCAAVF